MVNRMEPMCGWCGAELTADDALLCPDCVIKRNEKRAAMDTAKIAKEIDEASKRWNYLSLLPKLEEVQIKTGMRYITCHMCRDLVKVNPVDKDNTYTTCPSCGHSMRLKVPAEKNAESVEKEINSRKITPMPLEYMPHSRIKKGKKE